MKYFKSRDNRSWYGFEPEDKTGLVEITEAEWNAHLADITPKELTAAQKAEAKRLSDIAKLKSELAKYDYIGVKIAMGVATIADYATEIAHTEELRAQIRALEE